MKKRKILAGVLAGVMALSMLGGCGKSSDDNKSDGDTLKFEIVSKGFQSTYWQAVYKGASAKAKELGVEINMVGPNSESATSDSELGPTMLISTPSSLAFALAPL